MSTLSKTPFFSVVIPTFNRSDLFPYALRSILDQTFGDFEIIISDNCSQDNTPVTAKQFTDPRGSMYGDRTTKQSPTHGNLPDLSPKAN